LEQKKEARIEPILNLMNLSIWQSCSIVEIHIAFA
jgi:hypothetical protein